ncbi:MAG: FkbM family methyltransferase [Nitrospirales bacterium]|nr:FkbM family methyltransferase [Nitrospira sp.]MDR4502100.1 FkbM family methyltransferase [Nitrospirales bacterium]
MKHTAPSTTWLSELESLKRVDDIRARLAERYPTFCSHVLKEVIILGAAEEGERLLELCVAHGIVVRAIVDDNPERQGRQLMGHVVASVDSLENVRREIPVIIASHRVLKAHERMKCMGFSSVAPFALLEVLDSIRFPPHMFYARLLEDLVDHRERYLALRNCFFDERSFDVLDAIIGYRLTLDPEILAPIIEWDLYAPSHLIEYGDEEVYVDGGSYDGDTIRLFLDRVQGKCARVIAFEPDRGTYDRLKANFSDNAKVETVNAGLHRCAGTLRFDNAGTRGSIFSDVGQFEIPVVGLDETLNGDRVTFLKMNIEGSECEALRGAQESIRRWRPKLAISVYHNPFDLWQIPEEIRNIHAGYKFYLRQHDGGIIETVLYALPTA